MRSLFKLCFNVSNVSTFYKRNSELRNNPAFHWVMDSSTLPVITGLCIIWLCSKWSIRNNWIGVLAWATGTECRFWNGATVVASKPAPEDTQCYWDSKHLWKDVFAAWQHRLPIFHCSRGSVLVRSFLSCITEHESNQTNVQSVYTFDTFNKMFSSENRTGFNKGCTLWVFMWLFCVVLECVACC